MDHRKLTLSEHVIQTAADNEIDCPSHPDSPIMYACWLCYHPHCQICLKSKEGCSGGKIYWNEIVCCITTDAKDSEVNMTTSAGGIHRLGAVEKVSAAAKEVLRKKERVCRGIKKI